MKITKFRSRLSFGDVDMITEPVSTEVLITEVKKVAKQPYNEWKICVAGNDANIDAGDYSFTLFNPLNNEAVLAAYNYFVSLGMVGKVPVPSDTMYLYLFNMRTWKIKVYEGIEQINTRNFIMRCKRLSRNRKITDHEKI